MKNILLAALLLLLASPLATGQAPGDGAAPAPEAPAPVEKVSRTPANIMTYLGASWLERPERDAEERPDEVVAAMELKPGMSVADVGVGTGYFARRIAKVVGPQGVVYGVDVQPEMLELLQDYSSRDGVAEIVRPTLGGDRATNLPEASVDWVLLVDTYHEFQYPEAMLADMLRALKPGGKVALVEYRLLGETAKHIKEEHRMSVKQVLAEWNPAGFELVDLQEFLPAQHYFIFQKKQCAK
jgi:predicted methyltransferase